MHCPTSLYVHHRVHCFTKLFLQLVSLNNIDKTITRTCLLKWNEITVCSQYMVWSCFPCCMFGYKYNPRMVFMYDNQFKVRQGQDCNLSVPKHFTERSGHEDLYVPKVKTLLVHPRLPEAWFCFWLWMIHSTFPWNLFPIKCACVCALSSSVVIIKPNVFLYALYQGQLFGTKSAAHVSKSSQFLRIYKNTIRTKKIKFWTSLYFPNLLALGTWLKVLVIPCLHIKLRILDNSLPLYSCQFFEDFLHSVTKCWFKQIKPIII